jgi:predicted ferric reductase
MIPALEFGAMHVILFQMALIPLTMSRLSIATLSESFIDKIFPLNRALRMHIHLGYILIIVVVLATIVFLTFFGLLCSDGEQAFCDKLTSEIMITGYNIMVFMLIIGGTSYLRCKIPYEIFYAIHHLVFIVYFVTVAHTLDVEQRSGSMERSQTFKWFSSTLLFYFCDRAAMHLNNKFRTQLVGSSAVTGSNGSQMIILKINRPVLFRFKPGQYAFLRIGSIDNQWHPFSIASGPDSSQLEFYIEVFDKKSWTKQLWEMLEAGNKEGDNRSHLRLYVEVMGPYGTSLAKTEDYSHVLAIGAGTGK